MAAVDECVGYGVVVVAPQGSCIVANIATSCQNLIVTIESSAAYLIVINPIPVSSPISENKK